MYFKSLDMEKRKKSAPREKDVNIKDFFWVVYTGYKHCREK